MSGQLGNALLLRKNIGGIFLFSQIYGNDMSVCLSVILSVSVLSVLFLFPDGDYYVATVYSLFCLTLCSLTSQNIFSILAGSHLVFFLEI